MCGLGGALFRNLNGCTPRAQAWKWARCARYGVISGQVALREVVSRLVSDCPDKKWRIASTEPRPGSSHRLQEVMLRNYMAN